MGFNVQAQNVTIQGLVISQFAGSAITESAGAGNDVYQGNYLGTNPAGSTSLANGVGITLASVGSTVGGTVPAARNLISANSLAGVVASGAGVSGVLVAGNLIGTDATGIGALANPTGVIFNAGVTASTIGGITSQAQNVISSNHIGVLVSASGTTGNLIAGNFIGPNITGAVTTGNNVGIQDNAPGNTIGGPAANFRNLISGNIQQGTSYGIDLGPLASNTLIQGNFIGVNATGTAAEANGTGILVDGSNVTIGGAGGASNLISGNSIDGIQFDAQAVNSVVQGNLIGTNATGLGAVPNARFGVLFSLTNSGNTVGGTSSASRNVISGNGQAGVSAQSGSLSAIVGNFIGVDSTGEAALGNGADGVDIQSPAVLVQANVISANTGSGIVIATAGPVGTQIFGNTIGLDANGETALGNSLTGISISQGTATSIGGTAVAQRNVISGNGLGGISITGGSVTGSLLIQGNFIGTDMTGAVALGNGTTANADSGIVVNATPGVTIGGAAAGAGNVISGQSGFGVDITGTGATGNLIAGNRIGTNATGTGPLANSLGGVAIDAINNSVGGNLAALGNVIAGNGGAQVQILTASTAGSGNLVAGNLINLNATGNAALSSTTGILVEGPSNTIGGVSSASRNVVSGSSLAGIQLDGATNLVIGNFVGTDVTGSVGIPNVTGILVNGTRATIGGAAAGSGNLISGNSGDGVQVTTGGNGAVLQRNTIGLNAVGLAAVPNSIGVALLSTGNVNIGDVVGTSLPGTRNIISGNKGDGIFFSSGNVGGVNIYGNFIGTDVTGTAAVPNGGFGIEFSGNNGTNASTIGASTAGFQNVISANSLGGIHIVGYNPNASATQTSIAIQDNFIGTDTTGTRALGNAADGILIANSGGVDIGSSLGFGNVIANNGTGIAITGNNSLFDAILNNSIHNNTFLGIDLNNDGVTPNTTGGPHTGPNHLQNFPVITSALAGNGQTIVSGTFNSTPSSTFTLQFFSSATGDVSGFGEGQNFLGQTTVTTDTNGNAPYSATLTAVTTAGQIVSATATDSTGDTSEFSQDATVANASTNLVISVTSSPAPQANYYEGQPLTYTIVVTNNGPNPSTGVDVTDDLPSNVTYVNGSATTSQGSVSVSAGTLTALLGGLAVNASATVIFQVVPNFVSPPSLTDTASVVSNENTTPLDATSAPVDILPAVNLVLALTQASSPTSSPSLDQFLTYTAIVTNNGPSPATNVTLDDILPFLTQGGLTIPLVAYQSASVSQGSFSTQFASDGVTVSEVDASFGTINSGFAAELIITVQTNTLGAITDSATVNSDVFNTNGANSTQTVTAVVGPASDLVVSFDPNNPAVPNPALNGQDLTFTIDLTNAGPSDASNVTLTDLVPANATFVAATAILDGLSFTYNPATGTVTFPTLASGHQAVLTLEVIPTSLPSITDMASVPIASNDPNNGNNSASLTVNVGPTADLGVVISGPLSTSTIYVGSTIQYVVTVTNFGPNQVNAVTATDTLPQGLSLSSVGLSQGMSSVSGQVITFNFGSLALNQTATATLTSVALPISAGPITDTATVADADTPLVVDPHPANNNASFSNTISGSADVGVTISVAPNPVLVGQPFVYIVTVTNGGPSDATDVVAEDSFAPSTANPIFTGVQLSQGNASPNKASVLLDFGTIPAGQMATATLTAVASQATMELDNTVSVMHGEFDSNSANDSASIGARVDADAHLVVTGQSVPPAVLIGQDVTYTITVTNDNGPSDATEVTLFDTLPAGSTFVSVVTPTDDSSGQTGDLVTVSLGTLAPGQSAQVQITVHADVVGTLSNTANAIAIEANPFPSDATAVTTTTVNPSSDVNVSLSAIPANILLGQSFTYTANVLNNGPSAASGVVLIDTLPAGVTVDSATSTAGPVTIANGVATVIVGNLTSGGLASLTLVVTPNAVGNFTNSVQVSNNGNDSNPTNNFATTSNQVAPAANLSVTATSSEDPAPCIRT